MLGFAALHPTYDLVTVKVGWVITQHREIVWLDRGLGWVTDLVLGFATLHPTYYSDQ